MESPHPGKIISISSSGRAEGYYIFQKSGRGDGNKFFRKSALLEVLMEIRSSGTADRNQFFWKT